MMGEERSIDNSQDYPDSDVDSKLTASEAQLSQGYNAVEALLVVLRNFD